MRLLFSGDLGPDEKAFHDEPDGPEDVDYLFVESTYGDRDREDTTLEARRSLDYFESHYEQDSLSVIYTSGLPPSDIDRMSADLGVSVRNIALGSLFDTSIEHDDELARRCLPAIGAALRHDEVRL